MTIQHTVVTMKPLGDSALMVQLGDGIDPSIHEKVKNLSALLDEQPFEGFIESVPAYNNVTIYYNPYAVYLSQIGEEGFTPFQKVSAFMKEFVQQIGRKTDFGRKNHYDSCILWGRIWPGFGICSDVSRFIHEEVIRIHSENEYLVYMIGFAPGFPFMGGMNEAIATPRKESPRLSIAPGSVGIAGKQTGVYPLETPGGWQIIGSTPKKLFLPNMSPPTLLQSGDKIQICSDLP